MRAVEFFDTTVSNYQDAVRLKDDPVTVDTYCESVHRRAKDVQEATEHLVGLLYLEVTKCDLVSINVRKLEVPPCTKPSSSPES